MSYTVTRDDFSNIHNGLCTLKCETSRLEDVLNPDVLKRLLSGISEIENGFSGVRAQENEEYDRKNEMINKVQLENKFINSSWSIYEIEDFNAVPFPMAEVVAYSNHWGEEPVQMNIPKNSTWLDLWRAADSLIKKSGDEHHIFIEQFTLRDNVLILSTGS